jgi:hypothetical protein
MSAPTPPAQNPRAVIARNSSAYLRDKLHPLPKDLPSSRTHARNHTEKAPSKRGFLPHPTCMLVIKRRQIAIVKSSAVDFFVQSTPAAGAIRTPALALPPTPLSKSSRPGAIDFRLRSLQHVTLCPMCPFCSCKQRISSLEADPSGFISCSEDPEDLLSLLPAAGHFQPCAAAPFPHQQ